MIDEFGRTLPESYPTSITPDELGLAAHLAAAREDFLAYCTFIDPSFLTPDHIVLLASYLQKVESGEIKRLIITMPPRHGKSETTSGKFPGWCIGRDPTRRIILTSYGSTLAEKFSVQVRDTVDNNPRFKQVFPFVTLDPGKQGKDLWAVMGQPESMIASGINGVATGFGAWLLIIDDPIKNYQEAQSASTQDLIWNTYQTVSRTRLDPDGAIIIIMTRWHNDDLVGMIEKSEEFSEFTVLHLPALSYGTYEDYEHLPDDERRRAIRAIPKTAFPDKLKRPKDAPLWPERWTYKFLLGARKVLRHHFSGLYQGNPTEIEGNDLQRGWWKLITPKEITDWELEPVKRGRSWDLAWSSRTQADFTAGLKATFYRRKVENAGSEDDPNPDIPTLLFVVEHVAHWQQEWDNTANDIVDVATNDGERYEMLVEAVASQSIGFKQLRKNPKLYQHRITPIVPHVDKKARLQLAETLGKMGVLYILTPVEGWMPEWANEFLDEWAGFPHGKDDQIDALSQIVNHWEPEISKVIHSLTGFTWVTTFGTISKAVGGVVKKARELYLPFQENINSGKKDRLGWHK